MVSFVVGCSAETVQDRATDSRDTVYLYLITVGHAHCYHTYSDVFSMVLKVTQSEILRIDNRTPFLNALGKCYFLKWESSQLLNTSRTATFTKRTACFKFETIKNICHK